MDPHGQGMGGAPRSELEQFMMQGGMPQGTYGEAHTTVHAQYLLDDAVDEVADRLGQAAEFDLDGDYDVVTGGCHGEKEWERGWNGDRYLAHARISLEPDDARSEPVDVHWYQTKSQQPGMYVLGMEVSSLDEDAAKAVDDYVNTLVEPFSISQDAF